MKPLNIVRKTAKWLLPESLHPVMFPLRRQWAQSQKRQHELGRCATAILTETRHGRLLVPAADMEVGHHLAHNGNYGLAEVEFHLGYLTPESRVLVVGTHVGALLVPIARHVKCAVGIEANPDTFRLLEMNLLLNGLTNVDLYNVAAGDSNGEIEFVMHRCNTGASAIVAGALSAGKPWDTFDQPKVVKVPLRRLDDLLLRHDFDLIIMDIEGAEFRALQGMPTVLNASSRLQIEVIPHLVATRSQVSPDEFARFLGIYFPLARILCPRPSNAIAKPTEQVTKEILGQQHAGYDILLEKETLASLTMPSLPS